MPKQDPNLWEQVSRLRMELAEEFEKNAEVSYVDIGHARDEGEEHGPSLRIHITGSAEPADYPEEVDGFRVVICNG